MKPSLVVLAAGLGSRFGALKQMKAVGPCGETIIDYSIYDAIRAGFGRVVFVIRPDFADAFKKDIASRFDDKIEVDYAYQELTEVPGGFLVPAVRQKPWGTGHALLVARDKVTTPFAVINADDYYGTDAFRAMAEHLSSEQEEHTSMVGYTLKQTLSPHGSVSRGICEVDKNSKLVKVVEHLKIEKSGSGVVAWEGDNELVLSGDETVSMNFWGFSLSFLGLLEKRFEDFLAKHGKEEESEFYLPMAVDELIHENKAEVRVLHSVAQWYGVTYPQDLDHVKVGIKAFTHEGLYPSPLWK